jgi:class 3 adenylate cyclase/tetratricopeptide (TPR) repeat protein
MLSCPSCGEENPGGFRFCGACGTSLDEPARFETEERKIVTILFCDLVGFTARSDLADPEDVRAAIRPYHQRLRTEIERLGGTVEKFIGDAVMAVFGAPVVHEDDPERAVRAGLRILEAISELNQDQAARDLAVRIGINTGEAVVSLGARPEEGEGIVTGDVVNTAARLQTAAPVGGIVVGEQTYRATRALFDYEELSPVAVKGKAEPISIWRALEAKSRFGVEVQTGKRSRFVGREDELGLLRSAAARAVRESTMQLVTIVGEPGVGKSRLVHELFSHIDEQAELVSWRQGRCLPYGEGITFWALGEVVKAEAGILESDGAEDAAGKLASALERLIEEPSEREWLEGQLAPLVGIARDLGSVGSREEAFTAWQGFLEAIASVGPLVVVFEDLHWADVALLEFIDHLVEYSTGVPVLVVCTARPELLEKNAGWAGGRLNTTTLALSPLSADESELLIQTLVAKSGLSPKTSAALIERSGGNPLYTEEYVRMLTERRALGAPTGDETEPDVPMPESVHALIAARLDTLAPDRKELLHAAAVVGKVFWAGAVASIANVAEGEVKRDLHDLARKELVRPARTSSMRDEAEYSFWHALVRDVAYAQIPRAVRAEKHRATAAWIERSAGARAVDHADVLAYHYMEALELERASGSNEDPELAGAAGRYLVMAGDRAMRLDATRAEEHYRRALELFVLGDPGRAEVLVKAAEASRRTANYELALGWLEEAIGLFRDRGDELPSAAAMVQLADALRDQGQTSRGRAMLSEAVDLLEREPPGRERVSAYVAVARDLMLAGEEADCLAWSRKAIEAAEQLGMGNEAARCRQFLGISRLAMGDLGGLEDLRESLRLCLEGGLGSYETSTAYVNLGDSIEDCVGPAEALEIYMEGIAFAESRGLESNGIWMRGATTFPLFTLGRWDEVLHVERSQAWLEKAYGRQTTALVLSSSARVPLYRGHIAEAGSLARRFLPMARGIRDPQILALALAVAARIAQAAGDPAGGVSLVHEFAEVTQGRPAFRALYLHEVIRVLVSAADLEGADALMMGEEGICMARHRNAILTARATLTEARGDADEALRLYAEAAVRWEDFGFVLEHGQALLGVGRCLVGLGRKDEATKPLAAARAIFDGLGALPLVAESDALLP